MTETKRYSLGNQPEEYELSEDYLGWTPVGFKSWYEVLKEDDGFGRRQCPHTLTLASPDGSQTVSIIVHQSLSKDAFPLHFFGEARAENWGSFAKISLEEAPSELFIIPRH